MSSPALDALLAIKAQLETITVANGYAADVGDVFVGRAALAVGTKAALPALSLTTVRDDPEGDGLDAGQWYQTWTRTVALEMLADGAGDWETALDAIIEDVRRALSRYPRPLSLGGIAFDPPADGGALARASLQLTYSYTTDYSH